MLESRIVEVDGTFVGTLIIEADRVTQRFYATHDSVRAFHNRTLQGGDDLPVRLPACTGVTMRWVYSLHRKYGHIRKTARTCRVRAVIDFL